MFALIGYLQILNNASLQTKKIIVKLIQRLEVTMKRFPMLHAV